MFCQQLNLNNFKQKIENRKKKQFLPVRCSWHAHRILRNKFPRHNMWMDINVLHAFWANNNWNEILFSGFWLDTFIFVQSRRWCCWWRWICPKVALRLTVPVLDSVLVEWIRPCTCSFHKHQQQHRTEVFSSENNCCMNWIEGWIGDE